MTEKKYLIDGEPSSASDVMRMVRKLAYGYGAFGYSVKDTGKALGILRANGYRAEYNPYYGESNDFVFRYELKKV